MNVLLIGSGGREHALAWKLVQSPLMGKLYVAPGNPGMGKHAFCVDLDIFNAGTIIEFCHDRNVEFVIFGPEAPLVAGVGDRLREAGILVFGPSAAAAQLEGSKGFTKDLCARYNIPTGAYRRFDNAADARAYVTEQGAPIVVKADGLAAGKGVTVAMTIGEAHAAIDDCFSGSFGRAGAEVVVEAFLDGEEASFFVLCDGKNALALTSAQDHKRVGDGDTGPNTGGMGAYSPAPVMTDDMVERTMREIIIPTMNGMADMGIPFTGVFFAGLMITAKGPELIEYNVRFGDPECQVLMMRLKSDLLELLLATARGELEGTKVGWHDDVALTVVLAAKGYPGSYAKGSKIVTLPDDGDQVRVFHAGTAMKDEQLVAVGGRVLNVTALGATVSQAQARAYEAVAAVDWDGGFCRKDIGWRAVSRESGV